MEEKVQIIADESYILWKIIDEVVGEALALKLQEEEEEEVVVRRVKRRKVRVSKGRGRGRRGVEGYLKMS